MSHAIDKKIMIAFPIINSRLKNISGQKSVNLDYEYAFASAVNDAATR